MNPFDFLNAINDNKKNLFEDPQAEKDYSTFMVNRGLSFFPDTVLYANEMNRNFDIPKKWQFDFLLNSVAKKRRFSKWHKKEVAPDILKLIMRHYNYSEKKAMDIIEMLPAYVIEDIKSQYDTGGRS